MKQCSGYQNTTDNKKLNTVEKETPQDGIIHKNFQDHVWHIECVH